MRAKSTGTSWFLKQRKQTADINAMNPPPQPTASAFVEGLGEIAKTSPHGVLIVDSDPRWATAIENRITAHPRFEVAAVAGMVGHGVELLEKLQPSAVMLAVELMGTSGLEAIPIIRRIDPTCEIVLLSQGANARELASHFKVFGSVSKFRAAQEFDGVINRLATSLDQPAKGEKQRRTGEERRKKQEWNKVTSERRSEERRLDNVGYIPRESDALPPDNWAGSDQPPPKQSFY